MINVTTKNTILDAEIKSVYYTDSIKKHSLVIKYLGGEMHILIDSTDFGNFMKQVVDSYCEEVKQTVKEMKKENTK